MVEPASTGGRRQAHGRDRFSHAKPPRSALWEALGPVGRQVLGAGASYYVDVNLGSHGICGGQARTRAVHSVERNGPPMGQMP